MTTLAERVRFALNNAGMSQAELARACRVSSPAVSDWLSGKTMTLKARTVLAAATALCVDPRWLESGRGTPFGSGNISAPPRPIVDVDAEHAQPPDSPTKTVAGLLGTLRERIDQQPQPVRDAIASLISEYFKSPDVEQGEAVADAIERLIGKS